MLKKSGSAELKEDGGKKPLKKQSVAKETPSTSTTTLSAGTATQSNKKSMQESGGF